MKFETITVSSRGKGIDAALAQAEFVAKELGLRGHDALHMRLLVEEMMNMVRSIIGDLEGKFWIETDGSAYRLYLQSKTLLDAEQRAQLLSAATSEKNAAHRGIMGKLRAFFEIMPIEDNPAVLVESITPGTEIGDLTWSLEAYRERLGKRKDTSDGAAEEWDELEKSLVSHIADNIEVSIKGYDLQLMIIKEMGRGHEI